MRSGRKHRLTSEQVNAARYWHALGLSYATLARMLALDGVHVKPSAVRFACLGLSYAWVKSR